MIDYLIFLIYKVFKFFILLLPNFLIKLFLDGLAYFIYMINKEHKRYAKANLDLIYKDTISDARKIEIIKNSYKNLIYNLYEFIENPTLNLEQLEKKITLENESIMLDAIQDNRKIILVSAHYGNWEYITSYISLKYKPTTMVGRKMNNKYFNEDMENNRNKHNSKMLLKSNSAKGLVKALKNDRIIGLATDQHIGLDKGIVIDFLAHKAVQIDSTARIAVKFNAVIIPVFFIQNDFRNYTIKFYDKIEPKDFEGENQILKITQKEANAMSKQILEKPDLWFWQHRRFKEFYKEIYEK
ncbi:MAG: lipid A biosynthesis lauroyl acyltransferase [Campylobacterota bacterium]|nr:lipid A biosynthesis lauroyl acyltransferase [Campylobacterota bacterium]